MSARVVLAVTVALAAGPAWSADKVAASEKVAPSAKVSSPASSSGSSSGSWSHARPSSGESRSSSGAAERRSGGRSRDGGYPRGPVTDAQRRHPRPGTGTGRFYDGRYRGGRYNFGFGYGYGYGSRYRYPYYGYYSSPFDYWYSPYYYSGYYGYSPAYYRRSRGYGYYRDSGSVRLLVEPEKTRVYVDGYYAGVVDDFDGILQRLNVPPGRHDITLRLEGYRTQHFRVYVPVDDTIKIHFDMVRGSGEATSDEFVGRPADDYARIEDRGSEDEDDDRWRDDGRADRGYDGRDSGTVRIQVRPGDASVYVDGEFRGSGRQSASLRLSPGRHRIEVVRPGYRTLEREVEVRAGRTTDVDFDLERM
jgi:hypothetical protein